MATLNENIPFLYGELNKTIEYLNYEFNSSDGTIKIAQKDHKIDLTVNPNTLVILKQIKVDTATEDDVIKNYGLFAYNPQTTQFDIQLGDTIRVGALAQPSPIVIKEAKIGDQVIPASVNEAGQLVLEYLPVNAIKDVEEPYRYDEEAGEWDFHEAIIDGNAI